MGDCCTVGGGAGLAMGEVFGPLPDATFIEVVENVLGLEGGAEIYLKTHHLTA